MARTVDTSTDQGLNKAQLVSTHDGRMIVPVNDWVPFSESFFLKIPSITKIHHFRISCDHPGVVFCKDLITSEEREVVVLKKGVLPPRTAPTQRVEPEGLTAEHRQYLFKEIRQFCKPGTEDLVEPRP